MATHPLPLTVEQAVKLNRLRTVIVADGCRWTKSKCNCGNEYCHSYFISFTRSDGRMEEYEADFILLAREILLQGS